jgi:hypothetical protein
MREIATATASTRENPARRRRDPDRVGPRARLIPCRGLESTAARGENPDELTGPREASQPNARAGGALEGGG